MNTSTSAGPQQRFTNMSSDDLREVTRSFDVYPPEERALAELMLESRPRRKFQPELPAEETSSTLIWWVAAAMSIIGFGVGVALMSFSSH